MSFSADQAPFTTPCDNFDSGNCVTYSAQAAAMHWYSQDYPGWCTDAYSSLGTSLDCSGDNSPLKTPYNIANRAYCGVKVGGTFTWKSKRAPCTLLPAITPAVPLPH